MATGRNSRYGTLAEDAYIAIREGILTGALPFGELITRRRLAKDLDMSLPPVSEALQRLEHEGLVESRPRVGTRVKAPTEVDVRGQCQLREALEVQAARLFAQGSTAAQKREVREMAQRLDAMLSAKSPDRRKFLELHEKFHSFIPKCSGLPALVDAVEQSQGFLWLWLSVELAWSRTVKEYTGTKKPLRNWHQRLARALNSGDPERAGAEMRIHIEKGTSVIVTHLLPYLASGGAVRD
jgi:DNA-binding GntR family transcriptional regulator